MKVLFWVAEDWYFVSHRLPLAKALMKLGFDVTLVSNFSEHKEAIKAQGIDCIQLDIDRSTLSISNGLRLMLAFRKIVKTIQPDFVHLVALKPSLFGALVARWSGVPKIITAISGYGSAFTSSGLSSFIAKNVIILLMKVALSGKSVCCIVQNNTDQKLTRKFSGLKSDAIHLIKGVGINTDEFSVAENKPLSPIKIGFVGRLLKEKGINEFLQVAEHFELRAPEIEFCLAGDIDSLNPSSFTKEEVENFARRPNLNFLGRISDVNAFWADKHIHLFPSWREGMPKAVLESASCGVPSIVFDVPGCRDAVIHGETGLIVKFLDFDALIQALETLIAEPEQLSAYSHAARESVERLFASETILKQTLALYAQDT